MAEISPPSAARSPPSGGKMKRVGKYKLTALLGQGSFSQVRHGLDESSGGVFAIKMYEKAKLHKTEMFGALEAEIKVLKCVNSEYITNLHDVVQTDRYYYLVLDLAKQSLFDRIRADPNKKLHENVARRYYQQVILGVYSLHKQNIVHRDIKPENILLTEGDRAKLGDFGFSCPINEVLLNGMHQCGTREYLAPEVFSSKEFIRHLSLSADSPTYKGVGGFDAYAADTWSCGVVLYTMVCGKLPFQDEDPVQLKAKTRKADICPADLRLLSAGCHDVVKRVLVPDPQRRTTISGIMAMDWFLVGFDGRLAEQIDDAIRDQCHSVLTSPAAALGSPPSFLSLPGSVPTTPASPGVSPPHARSPHYDAAAPPAAATTMAGAQLPVAPPGSSPPLRRGAPLTPLAPPLALPEAALRRASVPPLGARAGAATPHLVDDCRTSPADWATDFTAVSADGGDASAPSACTPRGAAAVRAALVVLPPDSP